MTVLADILRAQINQTGPLTLEQYMRTCLLHPTHGYYNRPTPIGASGGFITAPEISQMFGEMVGLALAASWQDQGSPSDFVLLDLGPGRGTLMADCLRATAGVPGFNAAARVHLLEASHSLKDEQMVRLADHTPVWIESLATLPALPLVAVANEFFDTLPIRQFRKEPLGWSECLVGLRNQTLAMGYAHLETRAAVDRRFGNHAAGEIVEIRPAAERTIATLARHIDRHGGLLLIIDYGDTVLAGNTFQAVTNHERVDPLAAPGEADLTAHVDFGTLIRSSASLAHAGPVTQGAYLERLGITIRARQLATGLTGDSLDEHTAAFRRLVHPEAMGHLFKALALYPPAAPVPPGFAP